MEIISKVNKKRSRRDSCRRSRLRQGIAPTNNKPRSVNRAGFRVCMLSNRRYRNTVSFFDEVKSSVLSL